MKRGRVRITEVAQLAGVSAGTVSNTLNHPERVSEATRAQVHEAIRTLGYVPNQQARVLMGAPSNVLGLVLADLVSPFYMGIAHAVERFASASGYGLLLCNSENDRGRQGDLLELLAAHKVAGALLTPAGGDAPAQEDANGAPLVLIDYESTEHPCSVSVDHVAGGRMAAEHLIGLGHRRIAFVGGRPELRQFRQRVRGIREAIAAAGLPDDALVEVHADGIGLDSGQAAAEQLLASGDLPTAVSCGNDMLAFGVYRGLTRAGKRVPDDVALVGYDDVDFAANWIVPLTSVSQPTAEMGRRGAQLLISHAIDPDHQHQRIVLQPELIVRRSCGAPAAPPAPPESPSTGSA